MCSHLSNDSGNQRIINKATSLQREMELTSLSGPNSLPANTSAPQNAPVKSPEEAFREKVIKRANNLKNFYASNPDQLASLRVQRPDFAEKIMKEDMTELFEHVAENLRKQLGVQQDVPRMVENSAPRAPEPINPALQILQNQIEEGIRQRNIENNRFAPFITSLLFSF